MLLALGAASSAVDALQSLISSKSTSPQTTGFAQNPPTPFDTANGSTQTENPPPVTGGAGFTQISPATMSALIAAQGQDSSAHHIGIDHIRAHRPSRRAERPVLADRWQRRRQDQQGRIRKRARRRRHQPRAGRRRVQQARRQWRRVGHPRRNAESIAGRARQGSATIIMSLGFGTDRTPIRCCRRWMVRPRVPSPTATDRPRRPSPMPTVRSSP